MPPGLEVDCWDVHVLLEWPVTLDEVSFAGILASVSSGFEDDILDRSYMIR